METHTQASASHPHKLPPAPNLLPPKREYDGDKQASVKTILEYWWSISPNRPGPAWKYYVATAFYNMVIALVLTVLFKAGNAKGTWVDVFGENLLVSQCIGFSIHLGFDSFYRFANRTWIDALSVHARRAIHTAIPVVCVYIGYTLAFALSGQNFFTLLVNRPKIGLSILSFGIVVSFIWFLVMDGQTRRLRAEADEALAREAATALQKQAADAELRALQAQIEPHFLFNTLANVQALIDYEPAKAKHMLESFIEYLRATLDASRRTRATLGDEINMLERYLQLMQVRMGERLRFEFDVPQHIRAHPFAPLMLQPLVENAIKYGLEPQIEGGTVRISATETAGRICIVVADDGAGLHTTTTARKATKGSGTGMKNVLARLQSTFGQSATLSIADKGHGCWASVEFDSQLAQN